ncbi:MAG: DsbA family protein [Hyphomonadaceae bacterium]|nr:DsbA family protein [Hyphomonadaceae bacterium]
MFRSALTAAAALLVCACQPATTARPATEAPPPPVADLSASSFTAEQQADIRAVVRDYLVRDPTVLREAIDQLQARTNAEMLAEIASDENAVVLGPANAPITIVEFFDYRCPYCHTAMAWLFNLTENRRDVRVVLREFPILSPASLEAAKAALAAHKQGRYARFHQALMGFRGDLNTQAIDQLARESGVDVARMRREMEAPEIAASIERNHQLAAHFGVNSTPSFLINGEWVRTSDEASLNEAVRAAARGGTAQRTR